MTSPINSSRRDFLRHTATIAGAGVVAAGLPRRARAQAPSANARIGVGLIGLGGMGSAHLDLLMRMKTMGLVDIVAVCDVFSPRLATG